MNDAKAQQAVKMLIAYKNVLKQSSERLKKNRLSFNELKVISSSLPNTMAQINHQANTARNTNEVISLMNEIKSIHSEIVGRIISTQNGKLDLEQKNIKKIYDQNNYTKNSKPSEVSQMAKYSELYRKKYKELTTLVNDCQRKIIKIRAYDELTKDNLINKFTLKLKELEEARLKTVFKENEEIISKTKYIIEKINIPLRKRITKVKNKNDKDITAVPKIHNTQSSKERTVYKNTVEIFNATKLLQKNKQKFANELNNYCKNIESKISQFEAVIKKCVTLAEHNQIRDKANELKNSALLFLKEKEILINPEKKANEDTSHLHTFNNKIKALNAIINRAEAEVLDISNNPIVYNIKVDWKNVFFHNGYFNVELRSGIQIVHYSESRRSFNSIKSYFIKFGNLLINYDKINGKICQHNISDIIEAGLYYLEVQKDLELYELGNITRFSNYFNKISKQNIVKYFKLHDKSKYFNTLINAVHDNDKIIPVREYFAYESSESVVERDAFLFPIEVAESTFIIWESTEEGQATHIFKSDTKKYLSAVQNIFDYIITAKIKNKLQLLHNSRIDYFTKTSAKYVGSVKHVDHDFNHWLKHLVNKLSQ